LKPQDLLAALVRAKNATAVRDVLTQHAHDEGKASHLDLPRWHLGGHEANAHSVHAMRYVGNAAYEKITNMHDAVIAHLASKSWFRNDPQTGMDALTEISDRRRAGERLPNAYVVTTTSKGTGTGKTKAQANVSFIDEGIGIEPDRMSDTILSLGASNKLRDPIMMGCYGQGGSAIYAFSRYTLIVSRSAADPSMLGFTVVFGLMNEDDEDDLTRASSYAWLCNDRNEALRVPVADLDPSLVVSPSTVDATNGDDLIDMVEGSLILPEHGTIVKVWNLENSPFSSHGSAYNFLRDRGFSMPVPTKLVVGTRTSDGEAGAARRHQNPQGLRVILNDESKLESQNYRNVATRSAPREALWGEAGISCWIRDYSDKSKQKYAADAKGAIARGGKPPKRKPVIEGVTGFRERVGEPIYVTLNGMCHYNMRSSIILRQAGLEILQPYMIMEIDCDGLSRQRKSRLFTSSREAMSRDAEERLKADIVAWLKEEAADPASEISKARDVIAAQSSRDSTSSLASQEMTQKFAKVMGTPAFGNLLNAWGRSTTDGGAPGGIGEGRGGSGDEEGTLPTVPRTSSGQAAERVLNEPPTCIRVSSFTIQKGEARHLRIITDAHDRWADAVSVEIPSFLTKLNDPVLHNGRISLHVEANGQVGDTGEIVVTLDHTSTGAAEPLREVCRVEIVKREPAKAGGTGQAPKARRGLPEIDFVETSPTSENWDQAKNGDVEDGELAMSYMPLNGMLRIYWNTDFPPIAGIMADLRRRGTQNDCDKVMAECKMQAQILALMHATSGRDVTGTDKVVWGQALAAFAFSRALGLADPIRIVSADNDESPPDLFAA
jgi:hypothetical protein